MTRDRGASTGNLGANGKGFGCHKRIHDGIVVQVITTEGFQMEGDGRFDIRESGLIGVALPYDDAVQAQGIGDEAVGVLFDDDFQLFFHGCP